MNQQGWTDTNSVFSIASGQHLVSSTANTGGTNLFYTDGLLRPSTEYASLGDQQVIVNFVMGSSSSIWAGVDLTTTGGGTGYVAWVDTSNMYVGYITSGSLSNEGMASVSLSTGTAYQLVFFATPSASPYYQATIATQSNPTTILAHAQWYVVPNPSGGQIGIEMKDTSAYVQQIYTYTSIPYTAGNVITQQGLLTGGMQNLAGGIKG